MQAPRVRVMAGPNGSGKSSLLAALPTKLQLGVYLNADEVQATLTRGQPYSFRGMEAAPDQSSWQDWLRNAPDRRPLTEAHSALVDGLEWHENGSLSLGGAKLPPGNALAHVAATAIDFLRDWLRERALDFTFETVMSDQRKVEFLRLCREQGYRTYLYFVCTRSPELNVERVRSRTRQGGHSVPEDTIRSRYVRCLTILPEALPHTTRAFFFDNSTSGSSRPAWLAEWSLEEMELRHFAEEQPAWLGHLVPPKGSSIRVGPPRT
jgi:predicted ABC-type ATPase